jgi:hypothetical protein
LALNPADVPAIFSKRATNCRHAPQGARKLHAFGLGTRHFAEHFASAGGAKLAHLG